MFQGLNVVIRQYYCLRLVYITIKTSTTTIFSVLYGGFFLRVNDNKNKMKIKLMSSPTIYILHHNLLLWNILQDHVHISER